MPGAVGVRPRDFTFAVPGDWVRIRVLDDAERDADIRRTARAVIRGRPDRDRLMPQVARVLHDAVAARVDSRTVEVHLPVLQEGAPPLACALAVGVVPPAAGDRPGAHEAAFLAAAGPGGSADVVELPCGPVARLRRRVLAPAPGGRPVQTAVAQYHHPVPGGGFVLLSFSTPLLELLDPLTALFDAVAGSFRWLP
ncbi:hypothetical protein E9549_05295 [Blastococcus sp. MG754426]|uniref:hypothetical protein n=1 Tax=unclassified Blastococcus TaxID=2619396 RepID=UPI001EF0E7A5|nr:MULTISPECIES: hypothetical protein [unclassified Blastococcus]MCF6506823.1 hypothetical protein [Blastococcus sp. MG754426]MCF6733727.1 hypothetical protein [Blastococcus sp. KM273129]